MKLLLKAGGILNLVMGIFHFMFWKLFNWPESLASLAEVQQAIMQELAVHVGLTVLFFGILSLVYTDALLNSSLGKFILRFIGLFYVARAVNQVIFSEVSSAEGIGITVTVLILGGLYFWVAKDPRQVQAD